MLKKIRRRTFILGILKSYHTNLFMEGMMSFGQIEGNMNAGCPKLQAPPMLTSFEEVRVKCAPFIRFKNYGQFQLNKVLVTQKRTSAVLFPHQVSSDFICPEGEKRVSIYDSTTKTDVEACSKLIFPFVLFSYQMFSKKFSNSPSNCCSSVTSPNYNSKLWEIEPLKV